MGRVRKIKGAQEQLLALSPPLVKEPEKFKGIWKKEFFQNDNPLHIEIGTGKGTFINTLAARNSQINYLGVEKVEDVLLKAVQKCYTNNLPNLAFLWIDVNNIVDYFSPGEVDRLYINFCDPWPKNRHTKRRLTYKEFLLMYKKILSDQGEIHFKTDNEGLFEFSLNEFSDQGWRLKNISLDLYKNLPDDNIATEYEEKFVQKGNKIFRLEAF